MFYQAFIIEKSGQVKKCPNLLKFDWSQFAEDISHRPHTRRDAEA